MSIPWANQYLRRAVFSPAFILLGVLYPLEGLRRTWLGGLSLGLFIDIGSCPHESCEREVVYLRNYLDHDRDIIMAIPEIAWPLIGPWIDYHNAAETFYDIAMILCLQKQGLENLPSSCRVAWQQ